MFLGKKEKNFDKEVNIAIALEIERFGMANAEHFKSYVHLEKIAGYKINPEYEANNYSQQAGFSAEIKTEARTNAENIINKSNKRISRTDNIGSVNHQQYDHVQVSKNGKPIINDNGSYVGGSQQKMHKSIATYAKYSKGELYLKYKDTPIDVPTDQLYEILDMYSNDIKILEEQERVLRANGKLELADSTLAEINKKKDVMSRFRDSKVSLDDAMEARKHHIVSVGKDIVRISHKAGVESAKFGAKFGLFISSLNNIISFRKDEKEIKQVMLDITLDTGKSGLFAYASGFSSTAIQGVLKASNKQILQNMSKGNIPTAILQTGMILSKQAKDLILGEISINDFMKNIGQEGHSLASSIAGANFGAIVGTAIFPGAGTIVGGVIGGITASIITGSLYSELINSINELEVSNQKRIEINEYCQYLIEEEKEYRKYLSDFYDKYLDDKEKELTRGFQEIGLAIMNKQDIKLGLEVITNTYGFDIKFRNINEFKKFIKSEKVLGED